MATNGLSTIYGGVEGEGFIKISVTTTQAATTVLPSQFNEECFIECWIAVGTNYSVFYVYNPGSTTAPQLVLANRSTAGTAATGQPLLSISNNSTYTTAFSIFLFKDADGKCSIRQNNNATGSNREAATVWIRKVG